MTATALSSPAGHAIPVQRALIVAAIPFQGIVLQQLLSEMRYDAALAIGTEAGLLQLARQPYDLVLLDVDLGELVVRELAVRLHREHRGCRVAVMVGWWDQRTPEMQTCCDVLVYKPVHPVQVREALGILAG